MRLLVILYITLTSYCFFCWNHDSKEDKNLYDKIVKEGRKKLIQVGYEIKKDMDILGNITQIVINVTEEYTTELQGLFIDIDKNKGQCELDRQLHYLYIVESCNDLFSGKSVDLFENLSDMTNNYNFVNIKQVPGIEKIIDDEKETNIMYICIHLEVCRPFPAFTNHLAHLLSQMVRIPITRFNIITKLLKEILKRKLGNLHDIINEEIEIKIINSLRNATERDEDTKSLFKLFAETITKKYKLYKYKNAKITDRVKALTLLIDIVDKAFEANDNEEAIRIEFDNVLKALVLWAMDEEIDIKMVLKQLCHHIFETIDFYFDANIRKEVKLLIEVYMTGTTNEDSILYDDLLCKGSNLLNNDILPSNIDITG